jgi:hypothetical protein
MWGLWGDSPLPTIAVAFDSEGSTRIMGALEGAERLRAPLGCAHR